MVKNVPGSKYLQDLAACKLQVAAHTTFAPNVQPKLKNAPDHLNFDLLALAIHWGHMLDLQKSKAMPCVKCSEKY